MLRTFFPVGFLGIIALALPLAARAEVPPIKVVVSIPPLRGIVEPIVAAVAEPAGATGGANPARPAAVTTLIPPGRSEHGYEIPPSKLAELQSADLVVIVGLGLESQVEEFLETHPDGRTTGKKRTVVRFADIVGIAAAEEHDHHHDHADEHEHQHAVDPHLWLDPVLVEKLAVSVTNEVLNRTSGDRAASDRVQAAGNLLRKRIQDLHESYTARCAAFPSKTIVVGHDAWQRLATRYRLETVAIAGLAATEPTPGAIEKARQAVQDKKLKVIFVEPQLSDKAGRMIAEKAGAEVRRLDPLGDGDWFAMMEANLRELERALGSAPTVSSPLPPENK